MAAPARTPPDAYDALVVGGGPGGAAAAYWLAEAGHQVLLVEKKRYPRVKTCGDGLTPRAVRQLEDMGLGGALAGHHRFVGLRSLAFGRTLELEWPPTPGLPDYGYVVTRHDLDALVAERAEKAGATVWQESEAVSPFVEGGWVRGAYVRRKGPDGSTGDPEVVRARYVIVADGSLSRFGRALGTARDRSYPVGMAIRGYFESPRHDEPWIESHLDVRDSAGRVLPGYGWIFPVGDGRVNVGVGLLSTFADWKSVNTSKLMDAFVDWAPESWGISPESSLGPPTGGKLPMGLSVKPWTGPGWMAIGDAVGAINPFNGEGIAYAYETGRMAATSLGAALACGGGYEGQAEIRAYEDRLREAYDLYFRVAGAFVRLIGHPAAMKALVDTGMRSRTLMEWVLRIMANMLRPDELGPAEAAYKSLAALARITPRRSRASSR